MFTKFLEFKAYAEKQFDVSLKILRTDGGGEFYSSQFQQFLISQGIIHQKSCPFTPVQNGIAERKHRHLTETTIALLQQSSLPLKYWFDALATSIFLINRLPSSKLSNSSPYELLFQHPPDYNFLKVFGCQCFPWLKPYTSHKLQPKSIPCVFIGYHPSVKGYRCLDPLSGRIYLSKHVTFNDTVFPFASISSNSTSIPSYG